MKWFAVLALLVSTWAVAEEPKTSDSLSNFPKIQLASEQSDARLMGLSNESSLGINLNGGNSDSQSYVAKQATAYAWTDDVLRSSGHYSYGRADGTDVARNWDLGVRYEHYFATALAGFIANTWEGDTFAGLDYRASVDIGAKYYFVGQDTKTDYVYGETGYRYQYEERIPGTDPQILNNHFGRFYVEGKKSISDAVYFRIWLELLPNFSRWQHYLINFEPSIGVSLSKNLSLKLAFNGRYDGFPANGKKNFDYLYTTSLVANY